MAVPRSRKATAGRRLAAAPAREERDRGGKAAADHEAGRCGTDERGLPVLRELPAPVGQLGDLRAQVVHRESQLAAGLLNRGADHLGALRRAHAFSSSPFSSDRSTWSRSIFWASSSAHVLRASSIAMSGVGGAPFLNRRAARSPANAASRKRATRTTREPAPAPGSPLK